MHDVAPLRMLRGTIRRGGDMTVDDAQQDLRRAYVGGGPGILVSALVWTVASVFQRSGGVEVGFAALFVGGMTIFPGAKLICRTAFHRANEKAGNPLGLTALESTIAMLGGLFAAWLFLSTNPALVFPLSAIAVGTHYIVFKTVYGDRTFWLLGAIVTGIGFAGIYLSPSVPTAELVAIVEFAFGLLLTTRATRAR